MVKEFESLLLHYWAQAKTSDDSAHDLSHIRRVWRNACSIVADDQLDVNWAVLLAATYFHDLINVPKDAPNRANASRLSAKAAVKLLQKQDFCTDMLFAVEHAIIAHSFSAGVRPAFCCRTRDYCT